jgi:hypothetical protein
MNTTIPFTRRTLKAMRKPRPAQPPLRIDCYGATHKHAQTTVPVPDLGLEYYSLCASNCVEGGPCKTGERLGAPPRDVPNAPVKRKLIHLADYVGTPDDELFVQAQAKRRCMRHIRALAANIAPPAPSNSGIYKYGLSDETQMVFSHVVGHFIGTATPGMNKRMPWVAGAYFASELGDSRHSTWLGTAMNAKNAMLGQMQAHFIDVPTFPMSRTPTPVGGWIVSVFGQSQDEHFGDPSKLPTELAIRIRHFYNSGRESGLLEPVESIEPYGRWEDMQTNYGEEWAREKARTDPNFRQLDYNKVKLTFPDGRVTFVDSAELHVPRAVRQRPESFPVNKTFEEHSLALGSTARAMNYFDFFRATNGADTPVTASQMWWSVVLNISTEYGAMPYRFAGRQLARPERFYGKESDLHLWRLAIKLTREPQSYPMGDFVEDRHFAHFGETLMAVTRAAARHSEARKCAFAWRPLTVNEQRRYMGMSREDIRRMLYKKIAMEAGCTLAACSLYVRISQMEPLIDSSYHFGLVRQFYSIYALNHQHPYLMNCETFMPPMISSDMLAQRWDVYLPDDWKARTLKDLLDYGELRSSLLAPVRYRHREVNLYGYGDDEHTIMPVPFSQWLMLQPLRTPWKSVNDGGWLPLLKSTTRKHRNDEVVTTHREKVFARIPRCNTTGYGLPIKPSMANSCDDAQAEIVSVRLKVGRKILDGWKQRDLDAYSFLYAFRSRSGLNSVCHNHFIEGGVGMAATPLETMEWWLDQSDAADVHFPLPYNTLADRNACVTTASFRGRFQGVIHEMPTREKLLPFLHLLPLAGGAPEFNFVYTLNRYCRQWSKVQEELREKTRNVRDALDSDLVVDTWRRDVEIGPFPHLPTLDAVAQKESEEWEDAENDLEPDDQFMEPMKFGRVCRAGMNQPLMESLAPDFGLPHLRADDGPVKHGRLYYQNFHYHSHDNDPAGYGRYRSANVHWGISTRDHTSNARCLASVDNIDNELNVYYVVGESEREEDWVAHIWDLSKKAAKVEFV